MNGGVWPVDSVKDVAEGSGISHLPDEVAVALAGDVEYRLHQLMEEATKFMSHGKRSRMTVSDVDYALKALNLDPLWGFAAPEPPTYRRINTGSANLYYVEDEEIDLAKVLQTPLPPIPREISYTAHWLAVEGVQPAVPQNPSSAEIDAVAGPTADKHRAARQNQQNQANGSGTGDVQVKSLVKHVLSRELQLYFDRLTAAATDVDATMREAALASLRSDTGLGGLVPYLIQWAGERVTDAATRAAGASHQEASLTISMMLHVLWAMSQNPTLFIEPYLHQLMPTILTSLLCDTLGPAMISQTTRETAAGLLAYTLSRYAPVYPALKPRIVKTLLRALVEQDRTLQMRFGALCGLELLGGPVIRATLLFNDQAQPGYDESNLRALGHLLDQNATLDQGQVEACTHKTLACLAQAIPPLNNPEVDPAAVTQAPVLIERHGTTLGGALSGQPYIVAGLDQLRSEHNQG